MKINKPKLIAALLTLLAVAYLAVLVVLVLITDDNDTAHAILFCGVFGPIIIGILYGMFLSIIE